MDLGLDSKRSRCDNRPRALCLPPGGPPACVAEDPSNRIAEKSMSKAEVVARQITNGAMKGDPEATVVFLQELAKINDVETTNGPETAVPNLDVATMRRIAERVLRDVEELEAEAQRR